MVSRDDCVIAINEFLKTKSLKSGEMIFRYLCEVKEVKDKDAQINTVCSNPSLLSIMLNPTLETLIEEMHINKVTDKNNNLITVF